MTWNYRIIHYQQGGYGLHEMFYNELGVIDGWTKEAVDFGCEEDEGKDGIISSLELALNDVKTADVIEEAGG